MSHETPAGLEEPLPQARQGPALDGDGQGEPSQAIAQVVGRARGGHAALGAPTNPNFFGVPEPVGGLRQFPQSCAVMPQDSMSGSKKGTQCSVRSSDRKSTRLNSSH